MDFEGGVEHLPVQEIMLWGGDFLNAIGSKGQGLGGGNTLAVGGDGVHNLQLLVVDLKNGPF